MKFCSRRISFSEGLPQMKGTLLQIQMSRLPAPLRTYSCLTQSILWIGALSLIQQCHAQNRDTHPSFTNFDYFKNSGLTQCPPNTTAIESLTDGTIADWAISVPFTHSRVSVPISRAPPQSCFLPNSRQPHSCPTFPPTSSKP